MTARAIYCLNNISAKGTELLPENYSITDDVSHVDGILVRSASMHDMEFPPTLRAIARAGAGVNNIPLDRAAEAGIVVFNTPGANANAVKELVLCGLFLGSRGIVEGIEWVRQNAEDPDIAKSVEKAKKQFAGNEVFGKKLGVIGLGAIGAIVANAALDLGMDVYGYDPGVSVNAAWRIEGRVHHVFELDEVLKTCDYLTIHVPAIDATKDMIGAHELEIIHEGAVFLNFSRDTLVNNAALAKALTSGRVRTYITDFATPEVVAMENVLVLPHLGASTAEAEENCAVMAVRQLTDYLDNGTIKNSVNFPACDMGPVQENLRRVAVLHSNVPNMISRITNEFGGAGVNIENLTNKAHGDHAYTLIDAGDAPVEVLDNLRVIEGVFRVRIVK